MTIHFLEDHIWLNWDTNFNLGVTMTITNQADFLTLLKGATFFASGGGGPYFLAKEIVETYFKDVPTFEINIVDPSTLTQSEWVAVAAGMAQPSAGASLTPQAIVEPTVNAVSAMQEFILGLIFRKSNEKFTNFQFFNALSPIEVGAINVTIPLITAYLLEGSLSVVDGDPSGRSVPTINLTTFAANQPVMPNMATSAGDDYEYTILSLKNYSDLGTAYAKLIQAGLIGIDTGLCLSPMTGDVLNNGNVVKGTLTDAFNVGVILEEDISSTEKITKIQSYLISNAQTPRNMKLLCTGTVTDYFTETDGDNDLGYLTVQTDDNRVFTILIQNENIIGQFDDETAVTVTGPDSICYIANEDCSFDENYIYDNVLISEKLSNSEEVNIHVVAIEASSVVTGNATLMSFWNDAYKTSRYYGPYNSGLWEN